MKPREPPSIDFRSWHCVGVYLVGLEKGRMVAVFLVDRARSLAMDSCGDREFFSLTHGSEHSLAYHF